MATTSIVLVPFSYFKTEKGQCIVRLTLKAQLLALQYQGDHKTPQQMDEVNIVSLLN